MLAHTGSPDCVCPIVELSLISQRKLPLAHILYILLCNAQVTLHGQLLTPINLLLNFICREVETTSGLKSFTIHNVIDAKTN